MSKEHIWIFGYWTSCQNTCTQRCNICCNLWSRGFSNILFCNLHSVS